MGIAVTLYSGENLSGSVSLAVKTGENFAHLKSVGLNDKVESMVVEQGYYVVLYQNSDFGGKRKVFVSGRYDSLNDCCDFGVSSIKTYTRCAAIVYTDTNYQGNFAIIDGDVDNFTNTGFFNNEISSIKIMPGYYLTFYKDANFQSDSITYFADVPDVGSKLDDVFSSVEVTYNFAVEVYPDVDFKGTSEHINNYQEVNSSDFAGFASFKSLKVNPGYCAFVFNTNGCTGEKIIYRGPCDITNTGNDALSLEVLDNEALGVYYDGGNRAIATSVPRLSRYGLEGKITSLIISPNYIVQLFKDSDYEDDSLMLMSGDEVLSVDLANYTGWNKAVSSIRVFDTTIPAVYLFSESKYLGQCVKRVDIDSGDSNYTSWYYNAACGRTQHIADNRLSSVLVTGDLKVVLYEDNPGSPDKSFTLYGPGFFDLGVKSRHAVKDEHLYDNIVSSINISSYTPHQSVPAARGYSSAMKLLKGDLHNHTLWSDAYWGGETDSIGIPLNRYIYNPNDTFKIYKALGYDFDGISDHVFGTDAYTGEPRYTSGKPRCIPSAGGKCSLSLDEWNDTKNITKKYEHNFNFAPLAGYEYCLGGIALFEMPHQDDPFDTDAHYNVFSTENIYYGQRDGWRNNPANRTDFYRWSACEYANNPNLIVQFNHPGNSGIGFNNFKSSEALQYDKIPFRLLEVFSKSADGKFYKNRVDAYKAALSNGWRVGATATTDNHDCFCNLEKDYADIRTVVIAEKPSSECVLDALRQRRVYATRIPDLRIAFSLTNDRNETAVMGGEIGKSDDYYLDLLFEGEINGILGVELHNESGEVMSLPKENGSWNKYNYLIRNNDITSEKCVFVVVKTTQYPDDGFDNDDYAAITSPIWFAPSVKFFSETNASGNATAYIAEGKYTLSQLQQYNFTSDWAKSAKLDEGLSVIMYKEDNFTGECWAVNSYDSRANDFSNLVDNYNVSASSNITSVWVYNPNSVDAYCNITNKSSNKLVNVSNSSLLDDVSITQNSSTGGNNQKFKFVPCGDTDPEYYYIVAKHSGSLLSLDNSTDGDDIVQYHSGDSDDQKLLDNQKFKLMSCGDGYFNIRIKSSSTSSTVMVLDVKDASTEENASIILNDYNGADNQKFKID